MERGVTGKTDRGRCEEGVVNSGKGQMCTPDGPKWTAQSVGSGGGVRMG